MKKATALDADFRDEIFNLVFMYASGKVPQMEATAKDAEALLEAGEWDRFVKLADQKCSAPCFTQLARAAARQPQRTPIFDAMLRFLAKRKNRLKLEWRTCMRCSKAIATSGYALSQREVDDLFWLQRDTGVASKEVWTTMLQHGRIPSRAIVKRLMDDTEGRHGTGGMALMNAVEMAPLFEARQLELELARARPRGRAAAPEAAGL